jgi:hypothetical protein
MPGYLSTSQSITYVRLGPMFASRGDDPREFLESSGKPLSLCYRFGPSTPSARSANLIVGDGTKNSFPASSLIGNFDYRGPQQNLGPERQRPMGLAK